MYTICDQTPWSQRVSYVEDQGEARALFDARIKHRRGSWRVELCFGNSLLRSAGPTSQEDMDALRKGARRAAAAAIPVRYSGRGLVRYVVRGEDLARDVGECPCVLPEQSCPACRRTAALASRMPWD